MKRILDPGVQYRPSDETNIRRTFGRIRRQQQREGRAAAARRAPASVLPLIDGKRRVLLGDDS